MPHLLPSGTAACCSAEHLGGLKAPSERFSADTVRRIVTSLPFNFQTTRAAFGRGFSCMQLYCGQGLTSKLAESFIEFFSLRFSFS